MTIAASDIDILTRQGEGATPEFKGSPSSSLALEVVALANTVGGRILLGVRVGGRAVGIKDTNVLCVRIQDIARNWEPVVKVLVTGTGTRRIRDGAKAEDCPEPEFETGSFVRMTFRPNPEVRVVMADERGAPQVTPEVRLLRPVSGEMTRQRLREALGLKHRDHFNKVYLMLALEVGMIEMTAPDKSCSSRRRYRLTPAGSEHLKRIGDAR